MKILFDISHPAHFHLFKNTINDLSRQGVKTLITARDKDVLISLLKREKLEYKLLAKTRRGYVGLFLELMERSIAMFRVCRDFKPDMLIGTSVNITHVARVIGKHSIVFNEDDDYVVPIFSLLSYPFAHKIINPLCIKHSRWRNKRVFHTSYHELAYLHPKNFKPDIKILKTYGLQEKKYIIVRFSALKAHHDVGAEGISKKLYNNIENLFSNYQIIKSVEDETSHQIAPWDMHHILSFAKMIISDSQTMTIEGAVLGIPAIRINTFIGKSTVIEELEKKYRLTVGMLPDHEELILETIQSIIMNQDTDIMWKKRRAVMLSDKIDFNRWMIHFINHELDNLQ